MADDILKNIPLPADLPENWTSGQTIAPTGAEVGLDNQYGYNYLMMQVNNAQRALKALAAQREEDLARIKYWVSDDPTSPASFIGGTWERIEDCTIWGASDTHPAGTKLEAGLPNITGYAYTRGIVSDASTKQSVIFDDGAGGAFSVLNDVSEYTSFFDILTKNGKNNSAKLSFNASTSNPIYGASNTVQPPAYCTYIWRRVA